MSWIKGRGKAATQAQQFDALLRPHVRGLYNTAYRYTGSREDAEDLVQDLLLKLYPRTAELERIEDLKPWLTRSLYNAFIDRVRRARRSPEPSGEEASDLPGVSTPDADVLSWEQREALNTALADLSPEHRAVVVLHLVEGYALPELERMMGVQLGTLKSRLHRAKAHLREALASMEPNRPVERVSVHDL